MTLPAQSITVLDPGLGLVTPSEDSPLYSGPAVGGTGVVGTIYSFSRLNDIRATLGYGGLAEDVALALSERGGPVLAQITAASQAQVIGAVSKSNGASPTITVTGTVRDTFSGQIEATTTGALGAGAFKYTLDKHTVTSGSNAPTYAPIRTIPAGGSFVAGVSGLTFTFPAGTYTSGDTWTFPATPALANSTDLGTAATVVFANPILFPLWIVTGNYLTAATASAMATALSGHLTTLATGFRYVRGIIDIGSGDTAASVATERANWSSKRVDACYGYNLTKSVLPYEGFSVRKTSHRSAHASRAARELISSSLARFASGPLEAVTGIDFDGFLDASLDNLNISTARTWSGIAGFYIANGRLAANAPSDFVYLHFGRIMDRACRTVYEAQLPFIAEGFRTVASPVGAIDPLDKADVEVAVNKQLKGALLEPKNARGVAGHVSAARYSVDGTNNVNSTETLLTAVAIRPLGYANFINTQIGFSLNV